MAGVVKAIQKCRKLAHTNFTAFAGVVPRGDAQAELDKSLAKLDAARRKK
jgi:hypothetical protein